MKILSLITLIILSGFASFAQVISFNIDNAKLDQLLAKQLDSIYQLDQSVRNVYLRAKKENAPVSVVDSLLNIMRKTDVQNLIKVESIVKAHGWLGPQQIGFNAAQGLFLVIQHADLETQERYLPIILAAEKRGEILSSNLAILEDRICMRTGKEQLYGSQGFTDHETGKKYTYPIMDVDNLDSRRKSMGMSPMQDSNLEDYKKELPNIRRIVKEQNIR